MKTKGFSLFEVVVYIAIVAIVMVSVLAIAAESMSSRVKAVAMQQVNYQSQFVMSRMTNDIRAATDIDTADLAVNSLTVTLADGTTHQYAVTAGVLTLSENSATPVALTGSDVIVTTFTLADRTTVGSDVHEVSIELTVENNSSNVRPEYAAAQTLTSTTTQRL